MNDSRSDSEAVAASPAASVTTIASSWSLAVLCAEAHGIARLIAELATAALADLRLFVHADTVVPDGCSHIPITVLDQQLSPRSMEWFMVAELLMRTPSADVFLFMTANTNIRGIDHWYRHVNQHQATSPQQPLYVDSSATPSLHALPVNSAKAFLSDREGLVAACHPPACQHEFGTTLTDWALRTGAPVVAFPLTGDNATRGDDETTPSDEINCPATVVTNDQSIRISGTRVSIVVPSWNCADYVAACLNSLLRQTVAAELIVVDDASTDTTSRVLDSFGDRITVVRHDRQRGANAARNTGMAAASGDFMAFADADNEYSPRWIEKLLNAVLGDPAAAFAYCGYTKQSSDGSRVENQGAPWDIDTLWFGNYIDMSSVVRRSAIPVEGLHEGFRPFDDWRLWLNVAQCGWHGAWVPEELFVKHVRDAGKTEQSMANPHQRGREIAEVRREFSGLVGLEKPVNVVIPASGCEDLTGQCLAHLGSFCGVPFQVIYVDNGSPVATLDAVVKSADDSGVSLQIIRNLENRGFTHAVNQGIKASGEANVLVLNNDCFVGPGCVENLARELRFDDRVAAAGPLYGRLR